MIIAISGKLSSGKTLSASLLYKMFMDDSRFKPRLKSIAKPVYEIASILTSQDISFIQDNKTEMSQYSMTYRELLQLIGQHYREELSDELWLDILFTGNYNPNSDIIIIDDLRYQNEVDYIKRKGNSFLIRLERYSAPINTNIVEQIVKEYEKKKVISNHPSETQLDKFNGWDSIISNKDDIPSLIGKLKRNVFDPVVDKMNQ